MEQKKIKIKLSHTDARLIADRLEDIATGSKSIDMEKQAKQIDARLIKMMRSIYSQVYIKLIAKCLMSYTNEKKYSLTYSEALALELILDRWWVAEKDSEDEAAIYRLNVWQAVSFTINQQTQ